MRESGGRRYIIHKNSLGRSGNNTQKRIFYEKNKSNRAAHGLPIVERWRDILQAGNFLIIKVNWAVYNQRRTPHGSFVSLIKSSSSFNLYHVRSKTYRKNTCSDKKFDEGHT